MPLAEPRPLVVLARTAGEVTLGGMPLFAGGVDDLMRTIESMLPATSVHTLVTPNVDQVVELEQDESLLRAYQEASLRIVDGFPLVLLAHLLGGRDVQRLTGADLLPLAARWAGTRGWRLAVMGGAPGVAQRAVQVLRQQYGADVVAIDFPKIVDVGDVASEEVIEALAAARPDVVFVCLGSPKQDVWVSRWRDSLPAALYIGAGAAVDFVAGTKHRAPKALQRLGLEWVFRMAQEPRRLGKRYLVRGPRFLSIAVRSLRTQRGRS